MAAKGYPGSYRKDQPITGLESVTGAKVFHAGTRLLEDRRVVGARGCRCRGGRNQQSGVGVCQGLVPGWDDGMAMDDLCMLPWDASR